MPFHGQTPILREVCVPHVRRAAAGRGNAKLQRPAGIHHAGLSHVQRAWVVRSAHCTGVYAADPSCADVLIATAASRLCAQSGTPPQGGGLALSHRPVRASRVFEPGLSSCETLDRQPVRNQAAARRANFDLIWPPFQHARRKPSGRYRTQCNARAETPWGNAANGRPAQLDTRGDVRTYTLDSLRRRAASDRRTPAAPRSPRRHRSAAAYP